MSSSTAFPEYLCLRQVACEHFPFPTVAGQHSLLSLSACFLLLPPPVCQLSACLPSSHHYMNFYFSFTSHFHQPLDLCLLLPPQSVSFAPIVPPGGSSQLPTLSGPDFCCIPAPLSPPAWSCSIALPTNTWCHYLRKGLEHPPWFSLVLPLAWSPPSPTQVCKSLLPMSASKLVYPPPIPAFITLPK